MISAFRRAHRRPAAPLAAAALLVGLTLSGCSQAPADLSPTAATDFQSAVTTVTAQVQAHDYAGALASLDRLHTQLVAETARGLVSGNRQARIQAAIDVLRADIQAAIPTPTPTPPVTPGGKDKGKGKGSGDKNSGGD